jgi:hypothetical protein
VGSGNDAEYRMALDDYVSAAEVAKQAQQRLVFLRNYNKARWSSSDTQSKGVFLTQVSNMTSGSQTSVYSSTNSTMSDWSQSF